MTLGERIKTLRTQQQLTQPQLAEKAHIEQSYLSKIENEKSIPSGEILKALLLALNCDMPSLLKDLQPAYIQKHLTAIPEVALHLNHQHHYKRTTALRWLVASSLAIALGVTLIFGGLKQLGYQKVFSEIYGYASPGIILEGEPEDIFDDWERKLTDRSWQEARTKNLGNAETHLYVSDALNTFRLRLHYDEQHINQNKGLKFRETLPKGSRIYTRYGSQAKAAKEPIPLFLYHLAALLGVFLLAAGFMGFIVEWRLRKL